MVKTIIKDIGEMKLCHLAEEVQVHTAADRTALSAEAPALVAHDIAVPATAVPVTADIAEVAVV